MYIFYNIKLAGLGNMLERPMVQKIMYLNDIEKAVKDKLIKKKLINKF